MYKQLYKGQSILYISSNQSDRLFLVGFKSDLNQLILINEKCIHKFIDDIFFLLSRSSHELNCNRTSNIRQSFETERFKASLVMSPTHPTARGQSATFNFAGLIEKIVPFMPSHMYAGETETQSDYGCRVSEPIHSV